MAKRWIRFTLSSILLLTGVGIGAFLAELHLLLDPEFNYLFSMSPVIVDHVFGGIVFTSSTSLLLIAIYLTLRLYQRRCKSC